MLHILREHRDFVPELNLVLEKNGEIIGQSVCVKSHVLIDGGGELPTLILGSICIANEFKRKGYGKMLLDAVFDRAAALGYGAMLFEGNIDFYGKSGCVEAFRFGIRYPGLPADADASFSFAKN